jgi:hypothetical protein
MVFSNKWIILGYDLNAIIQYSDENSFFEKYLFCDDGDELVLNNIKWFLDYGQRLLNQCLEYDPDELADFFVNAIFYSYLKNVKNESNKPPKPKKRISYIWQNDPDKELPELYRLMIDKYRLIAPETTYDQFKAIFTGQLIDDIKPIKWHQNNASELLYFNEAIKDKVDSVWHIYKRLAACFVKPDEKPFEAIWKSLKTNIDINLSPDKQKAIDELVSNF